MSVPAMYKILGLVGATVATGCAALSASEVRPTPPVDGVAIRIPDAPELALLPRRVVATGLKNPRGMFMLPGGALLLSEAGVGTPEGELTGSLSRLEDRNADGDFDDVGERQVLLDKQPSKNIMNIVRRDEVFGMAGMAAGESKVLAALAFFGGPSTILQIDGDRVTPWGSTHGNINDLTYDPTRHAWFAVASTTDEVVRVLPGGAAERVVKIPPLANGQDPVPAYLSYDFVTGDVLVSLFTGSPEGEEGGLGVELMPRAGGIVAVNPETKHFRWLVEGLTVPTDLEIALDGSIYVLEFCDAFLDPVATPADLQKGPSHGGFKRFTGRLLRVDRKRGHVTVIAQGLDTPTNLLLAGNALFVAEGMGTPGRELPGPHGPTKLDGFIERIELPATR